MNFLIASQNGQQISQIITSIIQYKLKNKGAFMSIPNSLDINELQTPWHYFIESCVNLCTCLTLKETFTSLLNCFS